MKKNPTDFQIRFQKQVFICRSATVLLGDMEGEYDHPLLELVFGRKGYEDDGDRITVTVKAQRNRIVAGSDGCALYRMDTMKPWSLSYGACVEFSHRAGRVEVLDRPFELHRDDAFRVHVARLLARTEREYNLHLVYPDEIERAAGAAEKLGAAIAWQYFKNGVGYEPIYEMDHDRMHANGRAIQAAKDAKRKAEVA